MMRIYQAAQQWSPKEVGTSLPAAASSLRDRSRSRDQAATESNDPNNGVDSQQASDRTAVRPAPPVQAKLTSKAPPSIPRDGWRPWAPTNTGAAPETGRANIHSLRNSAADGYYDSSQVASDNSQLMPQVSSRYSSIESRHFYRTSERQLSE